jgi:hypothetical protein
MAKLYADNTGKIVRFLTEEWEEEWLPDSPVEAAASLEFDASTNAMIVDRLRTDASNCRYLSGVFTHNGVPVSVNAPSNRLTDRLALRAIIVKLFLDQVVTAAEFRLVLRFILRKLNAGD